MTKEDIRSQIYRIVQDQVSGAEPLPTASGESTLDDLQFDSLDHVELVMAIEVEYSIEVPDDDADQHFNDGSTVDGIVDYVAKRIGAS